MRTVALHPGGAVPAIYSMVPAPGEPPVGAWPLDHAHQRISRLEAHSHDFPGLIYFAAAGSVWIGGRQRAVAAGEVYVIAPGDVIGHLDRRDLDAVRGWSVFFTADILGPDVPGSSLAWRAHPLLFPFVQGAAVDLLRLTVPAPSHPEWEARIAALSRELHERRDGYREAVVAQLVLLLVEVSRLAADVVDDLRLNNEPLLAEVFAVIEAHYREPLSLRQVAQALNMSPGHLTSTVRRRTGRTIVEWITERRMVQARRLLAGSALPVGEVGRRVGYPDAGYFARAFGRVHGVSPGRWRAAGSG